MLILPIKKKWFDMILSGEKKEEYREIKPYYMSRFANVFSMYPTSSTYPYSNVPYGTDIREILFRNGYGKNCPEFVASCTLEVKKGKPEWGAEPGREYYVLKIHEIKSVANMQKKIELLTSE